MFLYHLRNESKVVKIFEYFEHSKGFNIVMQYVEGAVNLHTYLSSREGKKLKELDAVCLFKEVMTFKRCVIC